MTEPSLSERIALSEAINAARQSVAENATGVSRRVRDR